MEQDCGQRQSVDHVGGEARSDRGIKTLPKPLYKPTGLCTTLVGCLLNNCWLAHLGNFQNSILLNVLFVAGVPRIISCGGGRKQAVAMATAGRFNGPSVGWRAALEETNLNPIPPS